MSKLNILVVENNFIEAKALKNDLKDAGYNVLHANSADVALKYIESHSFDLMITDINLEHEHINGIDLVKKLNKTKNRPVIYLTAHGDDATLEGIAETNHNYYLSKPYDSDELLKIIKLSMYKHNKKSEKTHLNHNTSHDVNNKLLSKDEKDIKLTEKENLFLTLMISRKNQIVSNDEIVHFVWHDELASPATLRQLISRVREKLEEVTIETHHGQGYRLKV